MKSHRKINEEWIDHNRKQDERIARWVVGSGMRPFHAVKVRRMVKYGKTRWDAELGAFLRLSETDTWTPHLAYHYHRKNEAVAKGVELVLKGYATKVIE